jgi:hypothetical protein
MCQVRIPNRPQYKSVVPVRALRYEEREISIALLYFKSMSTGSAHDPMLHATLEIPFDGTNSLRCFATLVFFVFCFHRMQFGMPLFQNSPQKFIRVLVKAQCESASANASIIVDQPTSCRLEAYSGLIATSVFLKLTGDTTFRVFLVCTRSTNALATEDRVCQHTPEVRCKRQPHFDKCCRWGSKVSFAFMISFLNEFKWIKACNTAFI